MTMRIEYDREAKALYLYVAEGEHVRAVEVEPLKIYPDVDAEGRILGIEFLSWDAFPQYIEEHGGLNQPERFGGTATPGPILSHPYLLRLATLDSGQVEVVGLRFEVQAGFPHDVYSLGLWRGEAGLQRLDEVRALHVADHGRLLDVG